MINKIAPDITRMIALANRLGELRVEYRLAAEIKRGKMPDEKKLKAMMGLENDLRTELQFLREKWGLVDRK
jgi:hypothetical protein